MKKILPLVLFAIGVLAPGLSKAQDFVMAHDTVYATTLNTAVYDDLTNTAADSIRIQWHVVASDFPADWMTSAALGICDNNVCYGNDGSGLWNGSTGSTQTSKKYPVGPNGSFDYSPDLTLASAGTHYITVKLTDLSGSRYATFVITRAIPSGVAPVNNTVSDALIYPNPATNELNIVYDVDADVKSIAVYNIIGKVMNVYKVTANNSANLDINNLPSGIYFARLVNSRGQVVVTKKFTKQ